MRKHLKILVLVATIVILTFTYCYSESTKKTTDSNKSEQTGFLSNLSELKQISDIMDILIENFVKDEDVDEITKKKLLHGAVKGMLDSLEDPHSVYFNKEEMEEFTEDIKGEYAGVGMVIQKNTDEALMVVSPIEDTPAYKAGIRPKDKILTINDQSTIGLTINECRNMLRGDEGTTVDITVYRESTKETKNITLTRAVVELKYVKYKMLEDGIGYLRLTQFGEEVYPDIVNAIKDLKKQGMNALIFDLRNNPGGSLEQSIKVASLFIDKGHVVSVRPKVGEEKFYSRTGEYLGDFPMVVMINEGSASASEIVSGALKDYKRAILLGEKSFGKGSVQSLIPLPDGDGIKLTIAKYYTPSGVSIHKKGIEPDIVVEESDDFLFFDGFITNIDEKETKENQEKIIEELKGEEEAKKLKEKHDIQLETATSVLKGILLQQGK